MDSGSCQSRQCIEKYLPEVLGPAYPPTLGGLVGGYLQLNPANDDKFKHCATSCILAKRCGGGASIMAGVWKELEDSHDEIAGNSFGSGDLAADFAGVGIASQVQDDAGCLTKCDERYDLPLGPDKPGPGKPIEWPRPVSIAAGLRTAIEHLLPVSERPMHRDPLQTAQIVERLANILLRLSGALDASLPPDRPVHLGPATVTLRGGGGASRHELTVSMGARRHVTLAIRGGRLLAIELQGDGQRRLFSIQR